MSLIEHKARMPLTKKAPVRVKLERVNCDVAKSLPPDGDYQVWFARLMAACGSSSPDFIQATLIQLQAAARLPNGGLSETALNAALAQAAPTSGGTALSFAQDMMRVSWPIKPATAE